MCAVKRLIAVKFISGRQRSLFHLVKDLLHVDHFTAFHIKVYFHPDELFHKHGNIQTVGIIASQVTTIKELPDLLGYLFKYRRIPDHFICNTMEVYTNLRNRYLRIQQLSFYSSVTIG